jgi:cellobiose-specific phosphotransferase system component IIC
MRLLRAPQIARSVLTVFLVVMAYRNGFIWLFGICLVSSVIVVLTLLRVPIGRFANRNISHGQERMGMREAEESGGGSEPEYHRVASGEK